MAKALDRNKYPLYQPYQPLVPTPLVADTTELVSATNHRVRPPMSAINATELAILDSDASQQLLHHSVINATNPLPISVTTPVNVNNFSSALKTHPDQELVKYLIDGLTYGFSIGFNGPHTATNPNNLRSATLHPDSVTSALQKEIERGHTSGPFTQPPWPNLHCSPLGSREKKDGSRRLIMDLSQPEGASINDFIDKEDFPCEYTHFDKATDLVRQHGRNSLLSKIDIKHAFRLLPVLPAQWILLGICWLGMFFVDTRLPFGLRSAPSIFNRFADAVCWIINHIYGILSLIHYSDDFLLVSPPSFSTAKEQLDTVKQAFDHLNIPIADDKLEGPQTQLVYLGILIDSKNFILKLPNDKYTELTTMLPTWRNRRKCTKQELQSLIGKLTFASNVVRPGRIFIRRLIDLSCTVQKSHHHISLNKHAKADIQWWIDFLPTWNQISIIPESYTILNSDLRLYTDASSTIGFGAYYSGHWIQSHWPALTPENIDFKELFAIVAACYTWGPNWAGKRIVFTTDNLPITDVWKKGSTSAEPLMFLTRALYLFAAQMQFSIAFKFIPGIDNVIADPLSRFQMDRFFQQAPDADKQPTPIPNSLWSLIPQYLNNK